jgi:hypothetical protein
VYQNPYASKSFLNDTENGIRTGNQLDKKKVETKNSKLEMHTNFYVAKFNITE